MISLRFTAYLACLGIYDPITPATFDAIYRVNETVCGLFLDGSLLRLVMQGTENVAGWQADFDALPVRHPILGELHSGFYKNLPTLITQLTPHLVAIQTADKNMTIEVSGHSKGAGEAAILAALLNVAGFHTAAYLFACPNAGYQSLADYLALHVPGVSYRNMPEEGVWFGDPVPLVPGPLYVPPYPHVRVTEPPAGFERMLDVEWHLGKYYNAAFANGP
jgi:hypothetical protein